MFMYIKSINYNVIVFNFFISKQIFENNNDFYIQVTFQNHN